MEENISPIFETSSFSSKNTYEITSETNNKKRGGRKFSMVWNHIIKGEELTRGRYKAICMYCKHEWSEGRPQKMRQHLASHCDKCPENVSHEFAKEVANEEILDDDEQIQNKDTKCVKVNQKQTNIYQHYDSTKITNSKQKEIDNALIKAFVCCNIAFAIIENPFFMDLLKMLCGGYIIPSRKKLGIELLEQELARTNLKVQKILEVTNNLTLGKY